ncbi:MAG TPA: lanthionine synthetase LanC family protein [Streptosporangiaceae bacterium]|nr:lanthionine synthetase LanC family protein [Streptosporangiaceae bacterium]
MTAGLEFADAARQGFGWIGSVAVATDPGLAWRDPEVLADDLYSGTAGVLFACAEAAAGGLDPGPVATGACARLRHLAGAGPDAATRPDDSLFSGWAGVAVALQAWSRATGDPAASEAAAQVRTQIAGRLLAAPADPERYLDIIAGDAGLLLALLPGASDPDRPASLVVQAAHALADRLAAAAEPTPDGPQWRYKAGWPKLMPGFSHGTAGVAYALAAAGHALHRPDLAGVATAGARTLLAIGDHPTGWAVPLTIPLNPGRPQVNYGWCHGPAGTARLFMFLDAIDPQPAWRHAIEACLQALRDSRLPARLYPGYWDNLARCCGTAGVGQLLLDRYQATGDQALLAWSATLATDLTARAFPAPGGVTWSNTEHTATPPDLPPEPGLMQGTAGIAAYLARHHALATRQDIPPHPIDPTPSWL